jgi:hypothetical protein
MRTIAVIEETIVRPFFSFSLIAFWMALEVCGLEHWQMLSLLSTAELY